MTTLKILIIEDEPIIAQDIAMMLRKENYDVVNIAMSYEKALKAIYEYEFDVALVDINLESKKDGIDLAKVIHEEKKLPFIYLTSYSDEDTLKKILPTHPSGYLIKPIKFSELRNAIELAFYNYTHGDLNEIKSNKETVDHFYIKDKRNYIKIIKSEILFAKAFDNYTYIFTNDSKILVTETLKTIEGKLSHQDFKRVHRSYVINCTKIKAIEDNSVRLGTHLVPVSKRHQQAFFKSLNLL